jgi:hypothetical protein
MPGTPQWCTPIFGPGLVCAILAVTWYNPLHPVPAILLAVCGCNVMIQWLRTADKKTKLKTFVQRPEFLALKRQSTLEPGPLLTPCTNSHNVTVGFNRMGNSHLHPPSPHPPTTTTTTTPSLPRPWCSCGSTADSTNKWRGVARNNCSYVEGKLDARETLFFIHGWPDNVDVWKSQVDRFRSTHRIVRAELPTFGSTTGAPGHVTPICVWT